MSRAGRKKQNLDRLPPVKREIAVAAKALDNFRETVDLEDGPTPERLAKAGEDYSIGRHYRAVEMVDAETGKPKTEVIKSHHIRVAEAPLDRLIRKQLLCPGKDDDSRHRNIALGEAGRAFREDFEKGGLSRLQAQDISRPRGAGQPWAPFRSEAELAARQRYRGKRAALSEALLDVVGAVTIDEETLETVGRRITGYASREQCIAVALDRLRLGLAVLDKFK